MSVTYWQRGQCVPIRYVQRGIVRYAQPFTVVEDGPDRTAFYLPMGAMTQFSEIDFATGAIEGPVPAPWHSTDVLRLIEPGAMHMISLMFKGGGGPFLCWYIDFIDPMRRAGGGFVTWDLSLDIVVAPNLRWQWKDEDHFERIQALGWVSPEKAAAMRREGERIIEKIERKTRPFDESWPSWRPDPAWTTPVLPDNWAIVPT
ncbi:MAG TPA: DUF402 domain-containing protein [Rhizomicrobium sp.]|jgi:hypothetical protein